jgi:uncharacterized protein with LGFP repeats
MSAIDDKYADLGGPDGLLGQPSSSETDAPDGMAAIGTFKAGQSTGRWTPAPTSFMATFSTSGRSSVGSGASWGTP